MQRAAAVPSRFLWRHGLRMPQTLKVVSRTRWIPGRGSASRITRPERRDGSATRRASARQADGAIGSRRQIGVLQWHTGTPESLTRKSPSGEFRGRSPSRTLAHPPGWSPECAAGRGCGAVSGARNGVSGRALRRHRLWCGSRLSTRSSIQRQGSGRVPRPMSSASGSGPRRMRADRSASFACLSAGARHGIGRVWTPPRMQAVFPVALEPVVRCGRVFGLEDAAFTRRGPVWMYAGQVHLGYPRARRFGRLLVLPTRFR